MLVLRISALIFAVVVQAAVVGAQTPVQPAPPPRDPITPPAATGVQQSVPQTPAPQPAQPTPPQPPASPTVPLPTPVIQPPTVGGVASPASGANTDAGASGATSAIGVVSPPVPLLPPGTVTPERSATAATFLDRAAALIDKALGRDEGKDLPTAGKVSLDRATLDEIQSDIMQATSMLK